MGYPILSSLAVCGRASPASRDEEFSDARHSNRSDPQAGKISPRSRRRRRLAPSARLHRLRLHSRPHRTLGAGAGTAKRRVGPKPGGEFQRPRLKYINHIRAEHRRSPRTQADADHVKVKTEMLQLRLMEKKRELVRRADVDALIDGIAGVTLTALSSLPARCAPRDDLAIRRSIERVVFEVRTEIANVCQEMADKCGEPPLDGDAR